MQSTNEWNDEKIILVEKRGFFTGNTGDFWLKVKRPSRTLTDKELAKFDNIRVRILNSLQNGSVADYMSGAFKLFPYDPNSNMQYVASDEAENKKRWMTLVRNRLCGEIERACQENIFILFKLSYSKICHLSLKDEYSGNVRRFIDKLQQCDWELLDAMRKLTYILEYADAAPAQASIADMLDFFGQYTQRMGKICSLLSEASYALTSMETHNERQQLIDDLSKYAEKYPELTKKIYDLEKRNHELEFNVKITVSQQRAAELIQQAANFCNYTCYKRCNRRTIINWEKKHYSKPDWYDKKLRVLGEAILADEVLQGMRRELMARDNLKRGYTRGNHSKE